jgi:type IV secretory pathway VirJ component
VKKKYQEIIAKNKELISAPGVQVQPWLPADSPLKSTPSERSPALYDGVINQFVVEKNPRYRRNQQGKGETYCNIFVWDVTRAMGAEIPHWVDQNNDPSVLGEGIELDANDVIQWLQSQGGWKKVDSERAQDLANQGYPVVATWLNPGGIGYIAVVRPGQYSFTEGPTIAQAGETNFNQGTVAQGF